MFDRVGAFSLNVWNLNQIVVVKPETHLAGNAILWNLLF